MGIFGPSPTVFDQQLDKATDECNTEEDWGLIMTICDKVKTTADGPKDFCRAIVRKITHRNPHVSLQALTVLDSCVNNCGVDFKKEVASQEFISQLRGIMSNPPHQKVGQHLKMLIRQWADDFKDDPQLSKLTSFYHFMRSEGVEFPTPDDVNPKKTAAPVSKDPNVVSSQQEAEDIAKAIEMSLKQDGKKKSTSSGTSNSASSGSSSLYPSMLGATGTGTSNQSPTTMAVSSIISKRTVKALYDFEAAEDNEVTFKAGDLISILDDSDANWWKGQNGSDIGLFPANFVTSDLAVEPEPDFGVVKASDSDKAVSFNEEVEVREVDVTEPVLEINEDLMEKTLVELQNTDPENGQQDSRELLADEESCTQMGPLIDQKLEEIDRKHLELTQLNEKIKEALNMYDRLMNEMPAYSPMMAAAYMKQSTPVSGMNPYQTQTMPGATAGYPNMYSHPHMQQAGATPVAGGPHVPASVGSMHNMYQQTAGSPLQTAYHASSGALPPGHVPQQSMQQGLSQHPVPGSTEGENDPAYLPQVYSDSAVPAQAMYPSQSGATPQQQYVGANYTPSGQLPPTGQQFSSMRPLM